MANKTIGQTTGHTDEALLISDKIDVMSASSVTLLSAEDVAEGKQPQRLLIAISVRKKDLWVKLQKASIDNDQKGIFIKKDQIFVLEASGMYFGEISAISESGTAEVYITVL